jgi:hypothetical protein
VASSDVVVRACQAAEMSQQPQRECCRAEALELILIGSRRTKRRINSIVMCVCVVVCWYSRTSTCNCPPDDTYPLSYASRLATVK